VREERVIVESIREWKTRERIQKTVNEASRVKDQRRRQVFQASKRFKPGQVATSCSRGGAPRKRRASGDQEEGCSAPDCPLFSLCLEIYCERKAKGAERGAALMGGKVDVKMKKLTAGANAFQSHRASKGELSISGRGTRRRVRVQDGGRRKSPRKSREDGSRAGRTACA